MFFFINILFIFVFILSANLFYRTGENFTYIKIIKIYLIVLFLFILLSLKFNFLNFNQPYDFLCLIMNFLFFISYILVIGIRFINSPSYDIINFLIEHNPCEKKKILVYLKTEGVIEKRFEILTKNKLILLHNDTICLTDGGIFFCKIFIIIKKFLGIETEG
jgi:formate-dependent nitrite reductase membrane component NrfD